MIEAVERAARDWRLRKSRVTAGWRPSSPAAIVRRAAKKAHPISSLPPSQSVTGFECQAGVTYQIAASRLSNTNPSAYEVALDLTSLSFRAPTNGIAVRAGSVLTLEMVPIDETLDGLLPERLTLAHDPGGSFGAVAFSAGRPPASSSRVTTRWAS